MTVGTPALGFLPLRQELSCDRTTALMVDPRIDPDNAPAGALGVESMAAPGRRLGPIGALRSRRICRDEASMRWQIQSNEQRDGRGKRQGNEVYGPVFDTAGTLIDPGQGIRIFLYVTAHSFDGYVWVRHVSPKSRELAYAG